MLSKVTDAISRISTLINSPKRSPKGPGSCGPPPGWRTARSFLRATVILAAALIVSPACTTRPREITRETYVMGTKAWITIYSNDRRRATESIKKAFGELYRIDAKMSNWKETSEISRLNGSASGKPFVASRELFAVIDTAVRYSRLTSGAFDITARPLVTLWGFEGGVAMLPDGNSISKALEHVGFSKIKLNRDSSTVSIPPGFELDLAGIAKGYAVDRCREIIERDGFRDAMINLGGNIYAMGAPPGAEGWKIGIRDPMGSTEVIGYLLLRDMAVATSGNYENFVEIDGTRYGHIIDPRTGFPVEGTLSVTVVAPTAIASDALSTGFFVLGPDEAANAARSIGQVSALFAMPSPTGEIEYIVVGNNEDRWHLKPGARGGSTAKPRRNETRPETPRE